jgi:hypothetical protein
MSTRRTASSQKKSAMARKKTPRRGGSRGRRRSSSFLQRYPRWAWWIGGTAVIVLYVFLIQNIQNEKSEIRNIRLKHTNKGWIFAYCQKSNLYSMNFFSLLLLPMQSCLSS